VSRVVVVWLVIGVLLLLLEMHHLAFYALFGAVGSFGAAIVALVAPSAVPTQVGVAVGLSVAGVVAVRPFVSKAFDAHRTGQVIRGVHGGLVGHEAVTLDEVGDTHRSGHVRMTGERWLAISGGGTPIPPDSTVVVTAVRGTTLVVWPIDGEPGGLAPPRQIGSPDPEDAPDGADGRPT
jgi:membrane protein implicated in regulation of membrane protease activity